MSYQTKRKIMNCAVYITLGIVIIAIISISIITFTSANKPVEPNKTPLVPTTRGQGLTATPDYPSTQLPPTHHHTPTPQPTTHPVSTPTPTPKPTPTPSKVPETTKLPAGNDETASFSLPTSGYIMKEFCIDVPVFSFTMQDYRTHSGIDISAPTGSAVCSIASGKITDIYNDPLFGKTIEVDHGGGLVSVYSNLNDELAEGIVVGISVGEGQILGAVGNSAIIECAESDHLHFEISLNNKHIDPRTYLDFSSVDNTDIPGNE